MISITRKQARTMRAVFRRIGDAKLLRSAIVIFAAASDGIRVQCRAGEWAVEHKFDGSFPSMQFGMPLSALNDFEGSTDAAVSLSTGDGTTVIARWTDGNIPREQSFAGAGTEKSSLLDSPSEWTSAGDFPVIAELAQVVRSAAKDRSRYVLDCIQLRGDRGEAAATDGRELLISSGFQFPWTDQVLFPRTKLFDSKELAGAETVAVAKTADHVVFACGSWKIWIPIEKTGRFPVLENIVPAEISSTTQISMSESDANFLVQNVPRLPATDDQHSPITIHCNGHVAIRAKASDSSAPTELRLNGSSVTGQEVLVLTNRDLLLRAAELEMKTFSFWGPDSPALCTSDRRRFVWKPLSGDPIQPDENAIRVESNAAPPIAASPAQPSERKPMNRSPKTESNNDSSSSTPVTPMSPIEKLPVDTPIDPIDEAEALKAVFRDGLIRTSRLCAVLRRQQRQAKIVKSTLLSLRQLGEVG